MMKETEKQKVPLEGILYGEISAWITLAGMAIAVVGLIFCFVYGGSIIKEPYLMKDLLGGKGEGLLWAQDSVFSRMPDHYWFFKQQMDGDELSMIGLVIACYGGVVGVWGMFASMFRKKEILLYKKGFYTYLALIVAIIMTLAALGAITL